MLCVYPDYIGGKDSQWKHQHQTPEYLEKRKGRRKSGGKTPAAETTPLIKFPRGGAKRDTSLGKNKVQILKNCLISYNSFTITTKLYEHADKCINSESAKCVDTQPQIFTNDFYQYPNFVVVKSITLIPTCRFQISVMLTIEKSIVCIDVGLDLQSMSKWGRENRMA